MYKPDPYENLHDKNIFTVTGLGIIDNEELPANHTGAQGAPPELSWESAPSAQSYAITVYDPDAPRPGGYWHWIVYDIAKEATEFPADYDRLNIAKDYKFLKNSAGTTDFIGAMPPAGTGVHRYYFVVYALDVERLPVEADMTPGAFRALAESLMIAWGKIMGTYEYKD